MSRSIRGRVLVVHGPNLNLLGRREPAVYGADSLESINHKLKALAEELSVEVLAFQSNSEGEIIDRLQSAASDGFGAVIINPGGYSHTSVAIRDAITACAVPAIEVHLSNVFAREPFRHNMLTASACVGVISGFGALSYLLALRAAEAVMAGTE